MNKTLTAIAIVLGMTGAANAFELGNGLSLDNTVTGEYDVNAEAFTLEYDMALTYQITPELDVYVSTSVDLLSPVYTGFVVGADYDFNEYVSVFGKVHFDTNTEYDNAFVGIAVTF